MFLPPARVKDFDNSADPEGLKAAWHTKVKKEIDLYTNLERFLDPLTADAGAARQPIPWPGFPRVLEAWLDLENEPERRGQAYRSAELLVRRVSVWFEGQFYGSAVPYDPLNGVFMAPFRDGAIVADEAFAEVWRPQDEYLEWHVVRDRTTNAVTRIDYTVEAPEYWETLAEGDPVLAATIYSDLLKETVAEEDLFFQDDIHCPEIQFNADNELEVIGYRLAEPERTPDMFRAGKYSRRNPWNTERGAVHLTHPANTLFAEINLAARATQRFAVRPDLSTEVDRFELTACGGFGPVAV